MNEATIFGASSGLKTAADVSNAIPIMDVAIQQKITKNTFRDLLMGLKILTSSMKQPDEELAFNTIIQWLELYLRVENALNPEYLKLREQFENYIPPALSYIAVALCFKPKNIEDYHFQLLKLALALLEVVTEETLKKVADLKPRLIACLWRPITFVGDYNTQLIVLRLTIKLLKCIDDNKQNEIFEEICSTQQQVLKENISSAVEVSNFQTGKFENAARELLNNFNFNLSTNLLVYSMRCKKVKLGVAASFYKRLHTEHLWVDLNYCPGTVTFNARYRANSKEQFTDVEVCAKIHKLQLNKEILTVISNASPQFSKTISNQNNLIAVRNIELVLFREEVLRLRENGMVLKYYNNTESDNKGEHITKSAETVSNGNSRAETPSNNNESIGNKGNNNEQFDEQHGIQTMLETAGIDEENTSSTDSLSTFKIPSLSHYENSIIRSKLSQQNKEKVLSPDPKAPTSSKRRFFTTAIDKNNKDAKKKRTTKRRYRTEKETIRISPPKRKQINKVKPMNHLARRDGDSQETIQEYVENGGIINITNYLRHGNESASVFNEDERRIILQNVNSINEDLERSVERFFRNNEGCPETPHSSSATDNVFDVFNDSFAEPGYSYRNFKLLKPKVNKLPPVKKLTLRKNARNAVQKPKKTKVSNGDEEATTSKAAANFKPQTQKIAIKRPMLKKKASGVIENTIPLNAIDLTSTIDIKSANNHNKVHISSTNSNVEPPEKKVKMISKKLCTKPKSTETYIQHIDLLSSSEEELRYGKKELKSSSDKLIKVVQQNYTPHDDESIIITKTKDIPKDQLPNPLHQNNDQTNCYETVINQTENDEIGIEIPSQTMAHIINIIEGTDTLYTSDIQENRQDAAPKELDEEILLAPTKLLGTGLSPLRSDILNVCKANEPQYNKLEEQPRENAQIEDLNGDFANIVNKSNLERKGKSLDTSLNNDGLIYRRRSDDELSVDSDQESNQSPTLLENLRITPKSISVKSIATTSIRKSTKRRSVSGLEPITQTCEVTTTSVTTHEVISNDFFLMQPPSTCSQDVVPLQKESSIVTVDQTATNNNATHSDLQSSDVSKYINSYLEANKEHDVLHNPLNKDICELLQKYKLNVDMEFEKLQHNNTNNNKKLDRTIEKVGEITQCLLIKAEEHRKELEESEDEICHILEKLNLHFKEYEKNTESFNCVKDEIETFLNGVSEIDFQALVNKEFETVSAKLHKIGNDVRLKLWNEYIAGIRKNFLKNISKLSKI